MELDCNIICNFLMLAMISSMRYWIFSDKLRIKFRLIVLIVCVLSALQAVLWFAFPALFGERLTLYRLIWAALYFAISCLLIKVPFSNHFLPYLFITAFWVLIESSGHYVQRIIGYDIPSAYTITVMAGMLIGYIPISRYLKKTVNRLSKFNDRKTWTQMCVISFAFVITNLVCTVPVQNYTVRLIILRAVLFIGMFALFSATAKLLEAMFEKAATLEALKQTERQVEIQKSYYNAIIGQMDEIRRARHDLRHHNAAIAALIRSKDYDRLNEYAKEAGSAAEQEALPCTGNLAVDSILMYFIESAKNTGREIEFDISSKLGGRLPVSDPDLCVIFGNLVENAIEAQKYVSGKKYIKIRAAGNENGLTLAVDNSFDGTLTVRGGTYISRKRQSAPGIVISSVKAVAEKYDGLLDIKTEGNVFMAGVVI